MTNYIKKAVELADGWSITSDDCVTTTEFGGLAHPTESRILLDALAAQLVRQVDLHHEVWTSPNKSTICSALVDGGNRIAGHSGSDRTMNTIKAIVDSGVLE